jgi:hypothetical protein
MARRDSKGDIHHKVPARQPGSGTLPPLEPLIKVQLPDHRRVARRAQPVNGRLQGLDLLQNGLAKLMEIHGTDHSVEKKIKLINKSKHSVCCNTQYRRKNISKKKKKKKKKKKVVQQKKKKKKKKKSPKNPKSLKTNKHTRKRHADKKV